MSEPIPKCFNCKNEIPAGKYYGLWKILKQEWDIMPDNEKERHYVGSFCCCCWESKKAEINNVLKDYQQHIRDGYLTVRERERERESKIRAIPVRNVKRVQPRFN